MNYPTYPSRNITIKRKSETGQAQILAALLFLLLIPTSVIIAQNATNITNYTLPVEGMLVNISDNQTLNETLNETPTDNITIPPENLSLNITTEINLTFPKNETNTPPTSINLTYNITDPPENETQENETQPNATLPEEPDISPNETIQNETDQNDTQETPPPTPEPEPEITIPQPPTTPILEITISSPDQMNRNEPDQFLVVVNNIGNGTAFDVRGTWILPSGFEPEDRSFSCGDLSPGSACSDLLDVLPTLQTETGDNEIKVEVRYYE
jgi:hypothetical protein